MPRPVGHRLTLRYGVLGAAIFVAPLACSSASPNKDGAAGVPGTGGAAGGAAGAAGTGDAAVGDATDALDPSQCPAPTPVDASTGGDGGAACNTVEFFGNPIMQETFVAADGGAVVDGGVLERPMGGTLVDGDYVLVRHRAAGSTQSRRTLRLLGGATRIEWAFEFSQGAAVQVTRYNLNITPSGTGFGVTVTCGGNDFGTTRYEFSASGDSLMLFTLNATSGMPENVYNYRRMCRR